MSKYRPLITYLSLSGISEREALYVGDTAYNSLCARGANVDFGIALWGNSAKSDVDADYVFHTPSQICLEDYSTAE